MRITKTRFTLAAVSAILLVAGTSTTKAGDIAQTAADVGGFTQLLHAARMAGVEAKLKGKGPFTVFAPTDEAFGRLPAGTLFKLLSPENKALLTALLNAHIVPGAYSAERLEKAKAKEFTIPSLAGPLTIIKLGGLSAGGAKVVKTDVKADNGLIHVVDQVVIPPKIAAALVKSSRK